MPRLAANLSLLYPDLAFLDRVDAAAADGFSAVECQFPYEVPASELARRLRGAGLRLVLMNAPPGDWTRGERGLAALPGREADCRRSIDIALAYAEVVDCPRLHVMAGVPAPGMDAAQAQDTYVANLAAAADRAAAAGRRITIEPLNPHDMPGYHLQRQSHARATRDAVRHPALDIQLDLYHCQRVEGDLTRHLHEGLSPNGSDRARVGHLQVAGVPDRHEPDRGEIDIRWLFETIDTLSEAHGWDGWVGLEYRPRGGMAPGATRAGLDWCAPWLAGRGTAAGPRG